MASGYTPKRTFKQKAKRFLVKLSLTAAFAGAVAGTGYNYYGTKQDVIAKVTSVDTTPSVNLDEAPQMVVHTDKGTFINAPTRMYLKDKDDAAEIARHLTPGQTVDLTVYGYNPHLLGYSRDDLHLYRNILTVRELPANDFTRVAPPATTKAHPPAGPQQAAPVIPPPPAVTVGDEDQTTPESCSVNSDLQQVANNTPRLARDLGIMAQLPVTGQPVYQMLGNPANGIQSCLFPVPKGSGSLSTYENKHARIARGSGTSTAFHEYFHAWQAYNENGQPTMFNLTVKDAAVANLMTEASAVAYELASRQEAANHGLKFVENATYTISVLGMPVETVTTKGASDNPDNKAAFNDAYNAAFAQYAAADAQTREAMALQAGGRAVVQRLLDGQDQQWRNTYVDIALQNVNNNIRVFHEKGTGADYGAKRDAVFMRQGGITPQINFIPLQYLGPDAATAIDKTFTGIGFKQVPKTPAASAPAAPAGPKVS